MCHEPLHVVAKWHSLALSERELQPSLNQDVSGSEDTMHTCMHTHAHTGVSVSVEFESYCMNMGLIYVNDFRFSKSDEDELYDEV